MMSPCVGLAAIIATPGSPGTLAGRTSAPRTAGLRSSCRRIPHPDSISRVGRSVPLDGEDVMRQLVPAHGGSTPEPDKENVARRIFVAVVPGSTNRASPMSYNEHVLT